MKKTSKNIRLSKNVIPTEYFITLTPNLTGFTFEGEEKILLTIKDSTNQIELHSDEIDIVKATFDGNLEAEISYAKDRETAILKFPKVLPAGKGELDLVFRGILNDKMRGFYRSKYQVEGKDHHMAVSQFESTDARRAFPCFDEPAIKSIFHVNLVIPKDHTAISNSVEKSVLEHQGGYKVVSFEPTPQMSTYLLAFIVGKFEHVEKMTKNGVLVRVFVTPGKKVQAEFALETAVKTIDFFSNYFNIPYPLPVMDLVAIPDFAAGAMENWGAVTYRETALLVDSEHTATANKQWVALVIAHELAHQWFGNLVTMEWWTHLWLNEGFASYIEYLALDHLFPEWDIWTQFVYMDHARALELDGLESTHPIEIEVHHPSEISEIFDTVSYSKGASIIRMLAEYLGEEYFRKGLQKYLKKHSYANASTADLWESLEQVSGKPVKMIMNNWTSKPGYPVVKVFEKDKKIKLTQNRFFSSVLSQKNSVDSTTWAIPISIISRSSKVPIYHLMQGKTMDIALDNPSDWIKLNVGEKSFLRIQYSDKNQDKLKEAIECMEIEEADRFGVIRDLFVLSESGIISTDHPMNLYKSYKNDESYIVWVEISTELARLSNLLAGNPSSEKFDIFARNIFSVIGKKIGWTKKEVEKHTDILLRNVVLTSLGRYGDKNSIENARKIFNELLQKDLQIDSDLRGVVYGIVAKYGNSEIYNQLMSLYEKVSLQEEKDRILRALCAFQDESLLKKSLEFSFSDQVRAQDSYRAISFIFANPKGRYLAWEFLKLKWDWIVKKYSGGHLFSRFVEPMEYFTKHKDAVEIQKFFNTHGAPGAERTILQVVEKIESNNEWLIRDLENISTFLTNH